MKYHLNNRLTHGDITEDPAVRGTGSETHWQTTWFSGSPASKAPHCLVRYLLQSFTVKRFLVQVPAKTVETRPFYAKLKAPELFREHISRATLCWILFQLHSDLTPPLNENIEDDRMAKNLRSDKRG